MSRAASPRQVADEECHVLLIERRSTLHTGSDRTRSIEEQLRPV